MHADEKLSAFVELERVTRESCASKMANSLAQIAICRIDFDRFYCLFVGERLDVATMQVNRAPTTRKVKSQSEVLRYSLNSPSRTTVYRHYLAWRAQQDPPLPVRCDMPWCIFHTQPLIWNGKPFKPILDHIDGNSSDNRPHMLRLICSNCDSQLETRGGGNRGKIEKATGGFAKVRSGKRDYVLPVETGYYKLG